MANREQLEVLQRGVKVWNTWRADNPYTSIDLSDAKLNNLVLVGANFQGAILDGANLYGAQLTESDLNGAKLIGANLSKTNLSNANLYGANLSTSQLNEAQFVNACLSEAVLAGSNAYKTKFIGADLAFADLSDVDLTEADLSDANLSYAGLVSAKFIDSNLTNTYFGNSECDGVIFARVDLSSAQGLTSIETSSPIIIDIDTFYKSGGNIPAEFLETCGVPESMITFAKSLVGQEIEYYSCFISHSSKDQEFCDQLFQHMKSEQLRVWYAPEDMKGGKKIDPQINEAIHLHDKLIIVLSEASMDSKWVRLEIQRALKREKSEGRRVLFPIMLTDYDTLREWELVISNGTDLAEEVREYFIPDFSQWKDYDHFTSAFKRLIADLRKNE